MRAAIVCLTAFVLTGCSMESSGSIATDAPVPASTVASTTTTLSTITVASSPAATTASSSPAWEGPCGRPGTPPQSYDHVIWIWMENKDESAVSKSTTAPFLHGLAGSCGTAPHYVDHGIHPSLPNYLAATSGGTQGVADDNGPSAHPLQVDNIFRQVRAVGKTAKSYEEAMPANCALHPTSRYAVKHNPAAYFVGGDDRAACEHDDVPFDQFRPDLAGGLPAFSLITPDICHDMHDCPVATGDSWLHDVVTAITASPTYRQGRTALFIVFDESQGGGTTLFTAVAPSIVPGTRVETELDHYSLLAFTEDALGITTRLGKAAAAPSLADAFGI
ncbi:MAG: alkaline phosphatase family protein [Ilumatobacteraceae bacterium]